jgi:hypothetical protein
MAQRNAERGVRESCSTGEFISGATGVFENPQGNCLFTVDKAYWNKISVLVLIESAVLETYSEILVVGCANASNPSA